MAFCGQSCWGRCILEILAHVLGVSLLDSTSAPPRGSSRGPGELAEEGAQMGAPRWLGREAPELEEGSRLTDREGPEVRSGAGAPGRAELARVFV